MNTLTAEIIIGIKKNYFKKTVPLHEPHFDDKDFKFIHECLKTTYVSTTGEYIDKFESKISEFTGSKYAICVNSGTSALHVSLVVAGVKPNEEVLIPSLSFVATANAVKYCFAEPHFVDVDVNTMGICPNKLKKYLSQIAYFKNGNTYNKKTKKKISALIAVHMYGHPCKIDEIKKIIKDYNIELIEDSAESLGSFYKNIHTGTFSNYGCLSFNGNKIITTGGGGAVITDSKIISKKIRHLISTSKIPHKWKIFHDDLGWNYRMPNINAALGYSQINRIRKLIRIKRKIAKNYYNHFVNSKKIQFMYEPEKSKSNYWLNTININSNSYAIRNRILEELNNLGLNCRPAWTLLHKLPFYKKSQKSKLINSILLEKNLINLPSSPNMNF